MYIALVITACLLCFTGTSAVAIPKPGDWTVIGRPAQGQLIKLTFAIKQHNAEWLEEKLNAVSYPDSPEYTNYMNFDEIAEHVYGEPEAVQAVTEILISMRAQKIDFTIGKDFIVAHVPFEEVEKVFGAYFLVFEHKNIPGLKIVSSRDYNVPSSLDQHVDFVSGLEKLSTYPLKSSEKMQQQTEGETLSVDPNTIAKQYNTSKYTSSNQNNSQAVLGLINQYFSPTDLKDFEEQYNLPIKPITKIVGKNIDTNPGSEASLDIQYIVATGRNVPTWFVSVPPTETYLDWLTNQINTTDSPWVHSVSYGALEKTIDVPFARRVDNEFMKFGISGRSVLIASGDSGADCDSDGVYRPEWPTSSAFVTLVGGTTNLTSVWFAGGGGFSNIYISYTIIPNGCSTGILVS